jgi:hypothetical protein
MSTGKEMVSFRAGQGKPMIDKKLMLQHADFQCLVIGSDELRRAGQRFFPGDRKFS